MKLFITVLLIFSLFTTAAQVPFFLTNGSTLKGDYFTGFTEGKTGFYFAGARDNGPTSGPNDSVISFCIRTDSSGHVLNQLNLNSLLGSRTVRFDGIGVKNDRVYITGAGVYYSSASSQLSYNKIFVLCLDTSFAFISVDTFSYGQNPTAAIAVQKSVFLEDRIVMGYNSSLNYSSSTLHSFLTIYDYNLNRLHHQALDSTYLARLSLGDQNDFLGIAKHSDSNFVVTIGPNRSDNFYVPILIDTSLRIVEWTDSFSNRQYLPSPLSVHYKVPNTYYCPATRHPSGAYFFGPIISTDSGDRIGLSKINNLRDTVRTRAILPGYYNPQGFESLPAFKTSVQLLRNQRELVVLGSSLFVYPYQQSPSYIRVGKYDTVLNLLWHRSLGKANTVFAVVGIHELQNGNLMVLASAYDYTNSITASTNHDLYAFILGKDGTPLSTFTIPTPSQNAVTLYPNPTQSLIYFDLPSNSATYHIIDLQGKRVLSGTYIAGKAVSVAALPPANYLYQVYTADGVLHSGMFTKQ